MLGLTAVLASGEVIRTGGKFVKATSGYDFTQLLVGSEGTLAVVTEAVIKLSPRPDHQAIILAPFDSNDTVADAVPALVAAYIAAAYWFTASTAFANPAVTLARAFTPTFAGIRLTDVPGFVLAQGLGAGLALVLARGLATAHPADATVSASRPSG